MGKSRDVSNSDDCIDMRDVIARFEELEDERQPLQDEVDAIDKSADIDEDTEAKTDALKEWDEDNGDEFTQLKKLIDELRGNGGDEQWRGDWYPITLIRDSCFVDAMRELVEDIGDMPKGFPSYIEIDWDATARNLQADYSSVDFGDVTYWYR